MKRKRANPGEHAGTVDGWTVAVRENTVYPGLWTWTITSPTGGQHISTMKWHQTYRDAATDAYRSAATHSLAAHLARTIGDIDQTSPWAHMATTDPDTCLTPPTVTAEPASSVHSPPP